jgi:signal transduction histidine kinase
MTESRPAGAGPRPGRPWRGLVRGLTRRDVLVAVAVAVVQVGGSAGAAQRQADARPYGPVAVLLLLAAAGALLVRRPYPVAALAGATVPTWVYLALDFPVGPVFVAVVVAVFGAIVAGRRLAAWVTLGIGWALALWIAPSFGERDVSPWAAVAGSAAWVLALGTAAELVRTRTERRAGAERVRAEEARRRAGEQRMAIARELHDVLAHHISLISVQAGVALHLMDERPEQARTALTAIRQASKESLGELRSVLELLRHGEDGAPVAPAPGLAALDGLVARTSAAGVPVALSVTGRARSLPVAVELAAYRIVQEALTNVTRHAGAARADVRLDYGEDELVLEVTDDGTGGPPDSAGSGSGLLGMAERAAALGGTADAGPRPGGGWRVTAHLPTGPPPLDVPKPSPDVPAPSQDVPEPSPDVPTSSRDVPEPSPDVPAPSQDVLEPSPDVPTSSRDVPEPSPDVPTSSRDVPEASPDVPGTSGVRGAA